MSMQQDQQQQQPPPVTATAIGGSYSSNHSGHTSFGPVIAVLVVIAILGVVAVVIGWLCSQRRIMGHKEYDIQSWVERKFSSCIDGGINISPPSTQSITHSGMSLQISNSNQNHQEK